MSNILESELAKFTDPKVKQALYEVYADGFGDGYDAALQDDAS